MNSWYIRIIGQVNLSFRCHLCEGQRRFLDSMSPYARQFAANQADLDLIGLPPTVAIEQRISRGGGKSTVGTVTEIYHFLRLLYAKAGVQHCPQSGEPVISQTPEAIGEQLGRILKKHKRVKLLSPVLKARKGFHKEYAVAAEKAGFEEMFIDGQLTKTVNFQPLARHKAHDIDFVVATISKGNANLIKHHATALQYGKGTFRALPDPLPYSGNASSHLTTFSTARVSPVTGESFEELDPHHFSFNSPRGWCPTCRGYGTVTGNRFDSKGFNSQAEAEIHEEKQVAKADPEDLRLCPDCHGARLKESSRHVFIDGHSLPDLTALNVREAHDLVSSFQFTGRNWRSHAISSPKSCSDSTSSNMSVWAICNSIARPPLCREVSHSASASPPSWVQSSGVPISWMNTVGLHPRDNTALLSTLQALKEKGNSLLLVEHDEDTIKAATHLIDLGPGAGWKAARWSSPAIRNKERKENGKSPPANPQPSLARPTGKASIQFPPKIPKGWLHLKDCHLNNLKHLDVQIPSVVSPSSPASQDLENLH